ncbi:glycosyltransferase family 2 protein [Nonlabens ulvanivorans]|uniref:glycosyltransferase family 2 protein n=1 Tax=Nonlabens ulvanivorans TaxID=906888 RepID=UPI002943B9E3|nr:glycosyltransferase [Nonlabens ulvanivorans]WOI22862.1 glycosyltransferase [Nonlabens ulvanivorans]
MNSYTNQDLQILIATMNRSDLSFLEAMFQCRVSEIKYRLIIVNQSKTTNLTSEYDNIEVFNDQNFGLSRSRNLAIEKASTAICWILDDDCIIMDNAVDKVIAAHNHCEQEIITFQTAIEKGLLFRNYGVVEETLSRKRVREVLSPEITFKKESIHASSIQFDTRFGLGAQFGDSENYVFLTDTIDKNLKVQFVPETIVKHDAHTSSDEPANNRVIYARGALAARENLWTAQMKQFKYVFFLWRKGYVKGWRNLYDKYMVFNLGINDYLTGFEGHRIGHPDL